MTFIGRKQELKQLNLLLKKNTASLVVVKGRRRIGKSRLIQEFGKKMKMYLFSGIPPTKKTTHKDQLNEFGWQLGKALGEPAFKDDDWNDLLLRLAKHTRKGKILIFLDEISWIASKDPNFLGKLKNFWDLEFKNNPNLILVLCGSVSSWIEKNILSSTGFLGRISLNLTLEELPLSDCNLFWSSTRKNISSYEKFKILSVIGGIPKYLEEVQPSLSAEENIKNLCFNQGVLLFNEFNHIFSDIFSSRSEVYKRIVQCLQDGTYEFEQIYKKLGMEKSGVLSEYLEELIQSKFIRREHSWNLKDGKKSKLSKYRICDNYLRFYLACIAPEQEKIKNNIFSNQSLFQLPGWESIIGLQFENLVLNNRQIIKDILHIKPEDIIYDNPFFQHKTIRQAGCQIDYMIQTRFSNLFICEIKFSKYPVKYKIIDEIEQKIKNIKTPRHISCRPVLIHVNGVDNKVIESRYFSEIIDFSQLLS